MGRSWAIFTDEAKDEKKRAMVWNNGLRYAQMADEETILAD
jgi:hypothetical protein